MQLPWLLPKPYHQNLTQMKIEDGHAETKQKCGSERKQNSIIFLDHTMKHTEPLSLSSPKLIDYVLLRYSLLRHFTWCLYTLHLTWEHLIKLFSSLCLYLSNCIDLRTKLKNLQVRQQGHHLHNSVSSLHFVFTFCSFWIMMYILIMGI